jgi:tyrosyl-tRNA synthetase
MPDEFEKQFDLITRGAIDVLPEDEFKSRLQKSIRENKPLRVKQGFDPTAPDIHLGHTVGIRKLRQFQDLGHQVVLIIGDYTGLVGDPSGRSATRPQLTYDEIMNNAETYQQQFFKILDKSITEVHFNGEWFSKMSFKEIMELSSKFTVARMLERDDFEKRYQTNSPISIHELFYPLMQAYDSVAIKADIEIGATEQKFNLLTGREIQQDYGVQPQLIITMPVLVGVDGHQRMSKSTGNYIGIDESPRDMFGKIMSIPDSLIYSYYELVTDVSREQLVEIKRSLDAGNINPKEIKEALGVEIVTMYHTASEAEKARKEFGRIFRDKGIPDDVPEMDCDQYNGSVWIVKLMTDGSLAGSNGEARRLIKVGKRRFLKLKSS